MVGIDGQQADQERPSRWRVSRDRIRVLTGDPYQRKMYVAGLSIPATIVMAAWKTALVIIAPSAFLLINVIYALGVAGAKAVAFVSYRASRRQSDDPHDVALQQLRAYRSIAVIIVVLSILYVVSCLPLLFGGEKSERYDPVVAVIIATVTFVELVMSIAGAVVARRNKTLMVEAVRLTSLAGSLVLLVLTQTALMSFAYEGDASRYNGFSGVLFGSCAALMGVYMLIRSRWLHSRHVGPPAASHPEATSSK